jgi:predicted nucleic acid-binding protein
LELLARLSETAMIPPLLYSEKERIVRDPSDDYLIAYGLIYECDYLVTGDADLLTLKRIRRMQMITAIQFLHLP